MAPAKLFKAPKAAKEAPKEAPDMYRECILCVMYLYGMYPK